MANPHSALVDRLLLAFGGRPYLRLWKQPVAKARTLHSDRVISFGVPGMADLGGLLACGRRLEVEVKTGSATRSKEQRAWAGMIDRFGGFYVLARSENDLEENLAGHLEVCYACAAARDDPSRTAPPK